VIGAGAGGAAASVRAAGIGAGAGAVVGSGAMIAAGAFNVSGAGSRMGAFCAHAALKATTDTDIANAHAIVTRIFILLEVPPGRLPKTIPAADLLLA
jgi:hypothetical protein